MLYYLPFWPADKIYEEFDPTSERKAGPTKYLWEVFPAPPIDGILVSRANLEKHKSLMKSVEEKGIHHVLRFKGPIAADCGAWDYVNEKEPRYDPVETIRFYRKMGFDIGVTVDHLVVRTIEDKPGKARELTPEEREYRIMVTLENAKKAFDEFQKTDYECMRLIGVAQGVDPESYAKNVHELVDYGFSYVGLGGLARRPTDFVERTLAQVRIVLREFSKKGRRVDLHVLGIGRESLLDLMHTTGVTSFDSASQLRHAWVAPSDNYYLGEKRYTAIRMRERFDDSEKTKFKKALGMIEELEKGELQGKRFVDQIVQDFPQYDPKNPRAKRVEETTRVKEEALYPTFEEKPWLKCECPICRSLRTHICVFRMSERNMRRGFHNVYQFHKWLRSRYARILVFTQCSQEKDKTPSLMPAYLRYMPSPIFKTFWSQVSDLPVEIAVLSAKYGLIAWNQQIAYYDKKMTNEELPAVERDLREKLRNYDRVYFSGLGLYREAVQRISPTLSAPVKIFPRPSLTKRDRLDIIELLKQTKNLRAEIAKDILHFKSDEEPQKAITEYS